MKKVLLFAFTALLALSCQKVSTEHNELSEGRIAITATVAGEVATRAEGFTLPTPALSEFSLLITGQNFEQTWSSFTDYNTDDNRFTAGNYTVTLAYGDSATEGYNTPAFAASKSVVVLDRNRTTEVALTAKLTKAIVEVKTTEAFDNYFPVSEFKLTTASNSFDLDLSRTEHLFVAASQSVKIDCSCIRQSNLAAGTIESLATQTIETTAPATRYVVTYDLTTVGGVKITVKLNERVIDTIVVETELNPNA